MSTKSNNITHTDILGSPNNYPVAWKGGGSVSGTPLIIAEEGTSLLPTGSLAVFKLSRKANATPLQVLKSTDSGATWTALTVTTDYTFSTVTNAITFVTAPATTDLIMVTYQTHTNIAVPAVNSEVLAIGDVWAGNSYSYPVLIAYSLINKVTTNSIYDSIYGGWSSLKFSQNPSIEANKCFVLILRESYYGKHSNILLYPVNSPAVKVFPYLTRSNGKAYLNLVFKEMKYNGTDWGDDSIFNIVDNVSTTTDFYGQTVLIGQKQIELPYFIGGNE